MPKVGWIADGNVRFACLSRVVIKRSNPSIENAWVAVKLEVRRSFTAYLELTSVHLLMTLALDEIRS